MVIIKTRTEIIIDVGDYRNLCQTGTNRGFLYLIAELFCICPKHFSEVVYPV